jgi:beta-N-acetylhexosaminidase
VPFRAAVDAGVAATMVGHLLVPAFDDQRPATLSRPIVTGQLRGVLGFDGLVCTDDMDMKAVSATQPIERAAVQAIAAGCDVVLACGTDHDLHARVLESIIHAVEQGELAPALVDAARARQRRAKERFLADTPAHPQPLPVLLQALGTQEHVAVAAAMAAYAS